LARFLADENIPKSVSSWLAKQGHEVIRAQDAGLSGAPDSEVANWAVENERVILTLDEDFIALCRRMENCLGAILIRTHPSTPNRITHLLSTTLSKVNMERHTKELLIVTDREVRIEGR
jgi:predicted nuclease of predicted toxin-antitoxin system